MDIEFLSLSGEPVAALKVLPSESIFNLKEKLYSSTPSACTFVIQLCLNGECLDDNICIGDLRVGSKPELQLIRTRKGAREMLFETPEAVLCLAEHYDALGAEECKKQLSAVLMDADGKDLGRRAKMEVLLALCNKLSKPKNQPDLIRLKVALAELIVNLLRQHDEDTTTPPNSQHKALLLRCFPWLGQEALLTLLDYDFEVDTPLLLEFQKHPKGTLKEMIQQLPPTKDAKSPAAKLRSILERSVQQIEEASRKQNKRCVKRGRGYQHGIDGQMTVPTLLDTPRKVLAAASRNCCLHVLDENKVELRFHGVPLRQATRGATLDAVLLDPVVMLQKVDWYLALEAVEKGHGVYGFLPEHLQADRLFLYAALERNDALLSEFLSSASRHEIRQWQWHMEQRPVKKKR